MNSQSGLDLICGEAIEELSEMAEGQGTHRRSKK